MSHTYNTLVHAGLFAPRNEATYANDFVFRTCCEEGAVGAEANTSDVQVAIFGQAGILQMGNGVSSLDIENLCGAVATGRNKAAVQAETHAADDALMRKVVDQIDIEHTTRTRVEDCEPVTALLLQVLG